MKKLVTIILVLGFGGIFTMNCQQSSEDFIKEFGQTACYKFADCTAEKLKGMSEEKQKMMKAFMPTRALCDKKLTEDITKESKANKMLMTSEELSLGKKCLAEIKNATCEQFQKEVPVCKEFNRVMKNKGKS